MAEKVSIRFDEDNLTIGDLEDFESHAGVPLFDALKAKPVIGDDGQVEKDDDGRPVSEVQLTAKALKALVFIVLRAERPDFTIEDARNIKVTSLELVAGAEDAEGNDGSADDAPAYIPPMESV